LPIFSCGAARPGHRQQAFRRAAREISRVPESELRFLADAGRLQDLPGIGDTTAAVIAEALAGETPQYLQKLLGTAESVGTSAGEALRAQLKGDLHVHSDWSDGGDPIRTMAEKARALATNTSRLTDHSPRLTIAHGLPPERLREQLDVVAELNEEMQPFRILTGVECDILETARSDGSRSCSGASTSWWQRAFEARMESAGDDAPHGRGHRESACRRVGPLHRPVVGRAGPTAIGVRRRRRDRGVPRLRHRARDQLSAGATGSATRTCCARRPTRESTSRSAPDAHAATQLDWQPYGTDAPPNAGDRGARRQRVGRRRSARSGAARTRPDPHDFNGRPISPVVPERVGDATDPPAWPSYIA